MKVILHTPRFYLREFHAQDAPTLLLLNEDPEVIQYTGDSPFQNLEAATKFIEGYDQYRKYGLGRWMVLDHQDTPYGWCGLKFHEERGFTDIGFRFFKKYWGQGAATETAKAVLDYAEKELQLKEVWGRTAQENLASRKVLEKIGMKYSHEEACHGIPDAMIYKITWT